MANLNPTAEERLENRERHIRFWKFAYPLVKLFSKLRYNYTYDDLSGIEPPYLIVCNHVLNLDPINVGLAMGNQGYFVATENLLHLGNVTKLLMRFACPIIIQKGNVSLRTLREILKTIEGGASVVLFPEGDRSFDGLTASIPPATAKIARKAGKLVCVRFEGGYLTYPRWATTQRRGRLHLHLSGVYDADAMAAMTDEELAAVIDRDLHEDAYARQAEIAAKEGAPVRFLGRHLALGMESTLFMCPECGAISTLRSDDKGIRCTAPGCSFSATYTQEGYLEGGRFTTITQWDAWQRDQLERIVAETPDDQPLFQDHVTLERYDADHNLTASMPGTLAAFARHATFTPDDASAEPASAGIKDIVGVGIFLRNTLIAHVGKPAQHIEVRGGLPFNALKYRYVYRIAGK